MLSLTQSLQCRSQLCKAPHSIRLPCIGCLQPLFHGDLDQQRLYFSCSPQHHVWPQGGATDFSQEVELPAQPHLHSPLHPCDRKLGAGLLLVPSADSSFLRKWLLCWLPVALSWLASILLLSTASASFLRTWLCRHLNQPCVSAATGCQREALVVSQRSRACFVPNHCWRLQGRGRVSQVDITCLAFSWLFLRVMGFRGRWSVFPPGTFVVEKHRGNHSHLQLKELASASILLTADEVTSHSFSGHITLGYKVN